MWKNKWMMLCLLIGNILLVGIVSGTPLYSHATMQRMYLDTMGEVLASPSVQKVILSKGNGGNLLPILNLDGTIPAFAPWGQAGANAAPIIKNNAGGKQ